MASKKLGNLIKEARTEAGLTQEQLARKIAGLSASEISAAERGVGDLTQDQLKKIAKATSEIDDLPDEVFKMARDVCAWEEAYRSGMYVKPETYPDKVTISHIREMLKRVEHFFEEYGWPTRDAFITSTKI